MMKDLSFFVGVISWGMFTAPLLYAQGISTDTLHEQFLEKTGKMWEEATIEEKKQFMGGYWQHKEETVRQGKERKYYESDEIRGKPSIETTLVIRTLFKRRAQKDWEKATVEEQQNFLQDVENEKQEALRKGSKEAQKKERERQKKERQRLREEQRKQSEQRQAQIQQQKESRNRSKALQAEQKRLNNMIKEFNKRRR